jgi:flagellar biosynthesis/type III secretory pathway M-ring protein FliF/YscJ
MSDNKHDQHPPEGQDFIREPKEKIPRWRRLHHSWIFWIFLFLMVVAMLYYIMSVDFILALQRQMVP